MKKYQKSSFTLIELLAAMAVFCILLAVSIRLFTGAQQVWVRSENKTDTFASARTAMEFFAARMQTVEYSESEPFGIVDDDGVDGYEKDSIWSIRWMMTTAMPEFCRSINIRGMTPIKVFTVSFSHLMKGVPRKNAPVTGSKAGARQ